MMTGLLIKIFARNQDKNSVQGRTVYGKLSGFVGIACNAVLFLIKFICGLIAGSISIISDAFNNLSDMASSVVTMIGFKLASKPADQKHPFGHGRMEYMSGFIVSSIIIVVGFELLMKSIDGIIHPAETSFDIFVFVILAVSILLKLWMFVFNRKIASEISSDAIAATAQDSINDVISTSAVLVCALISRFTSLNIDPYVGLAVSAFIIYSGIKLAAEMLDPLLGQPPEKEFVEQLKNLIMSNDMFCGTHDLIVHNYGPGRCFASVHVEVPSDIDIIKCHEVIDDCEHYVADKMGIMLVIHMDPIDTGEETSRTMATVSQVVFEVSSELSIHDFRMVPGENRINLIFDVVVPFTIKISDDHLQNEIQKRLSDINSSYNCVIHFDRLLS